MTDAAAAMDDSCLTMHKPEDTLFWTGTNAGAAADAQAQVDVWALELGLVCALLLGLFALSQHVAKRNRLAFASQQPEKAEPEKDDEQIEEDPGQGDEVSGVEWRFSNQT